MKPSAPKHCRTPMKRLTWRDENNKAVPFGWACVKCTYGYRISEIEEAPIDLELEL